MCSMRKARFTGAMRTTSMRQTFRWWWWCPDMMSLRRKLSMHENPTIIPTFVLGTATRISSASRTTVGSESTTASSMRLWRDRLSHPCHVNIFCEARRDHVLDEESPLYGRNADDLDASNVSLVVVVSGYDVVAAQTVHARKSYDHSDIRFGHRYADILSVSDDGRLRIDYGKFHETLEG